MLKILGKPTSINVRKVLWLCAEIGVPFDNQPWGAGAMPTDTPEFRALNPNAQVPVIVDGDFVLWESNTICRYLAGRHARTDLLPTEPRERARVEQWMDWQATDLNTAWRIAFVALMRGNPAHADARAIDGSAAAWNRQMRLLDEHLAQAGPFVSGARFTLADIVLGLSANRWLMTPIERPALPAVQAWFERLGERPAFLVHGRNGIA